MLKICRPLRLFHQGLGLSLWCRSDVSKLARDGRVLLSFSLEMAQSPWR